MGPPPRSEPTRRCQSSHLASRIRLSSLTLLFLHLSPIESSSFSPVPQNMPSSLIRLPLATPLRLESLGSRRSLAATLPCSQRHGLGMIAREPVSEAWFSANSTQRLTRFCFPPPLLRLAWPLQLNIGLFCFNDQETSSIQRVASRLVTHITMSLA